MSRVAGRLVVAAIVVVGAVAQGLTAAPALGTAPMAITVLLGLASTFVLIGQVWLLGWAVQAGAVAGAQGSAPAGRAGRATPAARKDRAGAPGRPRLAALGWLALIVLVLLALAGAAPLLAPLASAASGCLVAAASAGLRPWRGLRVFRVRTTTAIAALVVSAVGLAAAWVVALLAGLFLTGVGGGIASWLAFGIAAALLLPWWTALVACVPDVAAAAGPADVRRAGV